MSSNLPISQFNAFAKEDLQCVCLDEARKSVYATCFLGTWNRGTRMKCVIQLFGFLHWNRLINWIVEHREESHHVLKVLLDRCICWTCPSGVRYWKLSLPDFKRHLDSCWVILTAAEPLNYNHYIKDVGLDWWDMLKPWLVQGDICCLD